MKQMMSDSDPRRILQDAVASLPEGRVLAAVSGGPDSVALLLALVASGRDVVAGHVNHQLRGAESDGDEAFVRALTETIGTPVMVDRVDTAAEARRSRTSIESAARRLRYESLKSMMKEVGAAMIVTAHTEDDQAETVILRLVRGSGTAGLGGMPRSGAVERPFLGVPRSTVISALSAWGAEYRLDSSNDDPRFTRNRVRADVLPALRALNPRVTARLATTADILRADAEYIETQANRALGALFLQREPQSVTISRAGWAALHPALARGVARAAIRSLLGDVVDIDEKHIAEIVQVVLDGKPMRLHLPRDLQLRVDDYTVYLRIGSLPQRPPIEEARLKVPGSVSTEAGTLTGSLLEGLSEDDLHRLLTVAGPLHVLLDATLAGTSLLVRRRQPGDRVKPSGSRVTRKVQDVLVDGYVPRQIRGSIPIIANDRHILWIPGLVVDRRAAAMSRNPILHLAWQPNLPDIA